MYIILEIFEFTLHIQKEKKTKSYKFSKEILEKILIYVEIHHLSKIKS